MITNEAAMEAIGTIISHLNYRAFEFLQYTPPRDPAPAILALGTLTSWALDNGAEAESVGAVYGTVRAGLAALETYRKDQTRPPDEGVMIPARTWAKAVRDQIAGRIQKGVPATITRISRLATKMPSRTGRGARGRKGKGKGESNE